MKSAKTTYTTTRSSDTVMSDEVGDFMDANFYSNLGEKWRRVTDIELQRRGVDVVFGGCNIDEKVKVKDGYLNRILEYPSFELSFVNRSLRRQDGWLLNADSITDYYAFIAVFTDAEGEYSIKSSNIYRLNALFVKKSEVLEYASNCGINLRDDVAMLATEEMGERIDHPGTGIHMKISLKFSEKPVNMVVRRNVLLGLKSTREFDIREDCIEDVSGKVLRDSPICDIIKGIANR